MAVRRNEERKKKPHFPNGWDVVHMRSVPGIICFLFRAEAIPVSGVLCCLYIENFPDMHSVLLFLVHILMVYPTYYTFDCVQFYYLLYGRVTLPHYCVMVCTCGIHTKSNVRSEESAVSSTYNLLDTEKCRFHRIVCVCVQQ